MKIWIVAIVLLNTASIQFVDGVRVGAILDPSVEAGFGAVGRSDITNHKKVGAGTDKYIPINPSLFGQVGGGMAF